MRWQKFRVLILITFLVIGVECLEVEEKKRQEDGNDLFQFQNSQTTEIENNSTTTPIPNDDDYDVTNETPDEESKNVFEDEKSTTTSPLWATLIPNNINNLISVKDVFEKSMDVVKDELKGIGVIQDWLKEQAAIVDDNDTVIPEDYPYSTNNYLDTYDNYDEKEIEKSDVDNDLVNEDNIGEIEKTDKKMNERTDIVEDDRVDELPLTTTEESTGITEQIKTTTDIIDVLEKDLDKLKEIKKNQLKVNKERDELIKEIKASLTVLEGDNLDLVDISTTSSVVSEINTNAVTENVDEQEISTSEVFGITEIITETPEVIIALGINATERIETNTTTQDYTQTTEEEINVTTSALEIDVKTTTNIITSTENTEVVELETVTDEIENVTKIEETTATEVIHTFVINEPTENVEIIDKEHNIDIKIEIIKNIVTEQEMMSTTEATISYEVDTEANTETNEHKDISINQEKKDSNKTEVFNNNEEVEYTTKYWESAHHLVSEIVDEIIEDIKLDDVNHVFGPSTKDSNSIDNNEEEAAKSQEIKKVLDENIRANKFDIINSIEDKFRTIIEGPSKSKEQAESEADNESEKSTSDNILDDFNDYIVTKNDDFEQTNLITMMRDSDGYVCMNVTSLAIKIKFDKENEMWIPSTARQYGECNPGIQTLNFTWRANPNVPGNNTIGLKLHNDYEQGYIDEAALFIHNETFKVYKLNLHIEDPTVINFNSKVTVTIHHPKIKMYPIRRYISDEEFERQFAPTISRENLLLLVTTGILCATSTMIAIGFYVFKRFNNDSRIFKISVDK